MPTGRKGEKRATNVIGRLRAIGLFVTNDAEKAAQKFLHYVECTINVCIGGRLLRLCRLRVGRSHSLPADAPGAEGSRSSCKARIDFDASQPSKNVMAGFLRRTAGLAFASHQGAEHGAEKGASAARGVEGARRSPAGQKGGRRVHRRLSKRGRGKVGGKAFPALAADQ